MANQSLLARGTAGPTSVSNFRLLSLEEDLRSVCQFDTQRISTRKQGTGRLLRLLLPMMKANATSMRQQDVAEPELPSSYQNSMKHGARRNSGPAILAKTGLKVLHGLP